MKRINWIEALVLPFAMAVLTSAWLTLWLRWFVRLGQTNQPVGAEGQLAGAEGHPPLLSPLLMVLLILTGVFITRFALSRAADQTDSAFRFPWDPGPRARRIVLNAGFAAVVVTLWLTFGARFPFQYLRGLLDWGEFISAEFIALIAALYLWHRGITIGRSRIPYDDLERAFYGGILGLALVLGLNRATSLLAPAEITPPVLTFFAIGLGALALGSFERARRQQRETSGAWLAFNRHWLAVVAGVIGAILFGGLLLASLVAPETLARLRLFVSPLIDFLTPGLQVLLVALALFLVWITTPVFMFAEWLARRLLETLRFPRLPQPAPFSQQVERAINNFLQSRLFQTTSHSLVVLLLVAFFSLLFVLALRRFLRLPGQEVDETRESIISRELLLRQLKNLFARPRPARPAPPPPPYLALSGAPDDPRLIVRRAYQVMLEWASALGQPRAAGQTPRTYAEALSRSVPLSAAPEGQEAVAALTDAYILARYAAEPPSRDEASRAAQAAARLKELSLPKEQKDTQVP